jgi:exopolysaccharide biosynthesis polyprenyl glycosylphosphotransferase
MLSRNTNLIIWAILLDILCVIAAVLVAIWIRLNLPFGLELYYEPGLTLVLTVAVITYPLTYLFFSLYDPDRAFTAADEYQRLTIANILAALALAGFVYFTQRNISRLFLVYFYVFEFALVIGWRFLFRTLAYGAANGRSGSRRVLLIGGGDAAQQALSRLEELSWAGITLVGYLTDEQLIPAQSDSIRHLGHLNQAPGVIEEYDITDVLIALPAESYERVQQLVGELIDKPSNLWIIPDYVSLLMYGSRVENLGSVSMISLKTPTLTGYQRMIKRVFDLVVASLTFLISLPLFFLIAAAIKLDSPGPVIFKQKRAGENGKVFEMYKFRSMQADAEGKFAEVVKHDEEGNLIHKIPDDPRITRVGHIIRRTSLDELPQIINVLKGDMSLVGPRPEIPVLVSSYNLWQQKRFAVPQGITGWWQVNGRSDKLLHLHTEDDLYYIQNYSLWLDIQILFKTIPVVLQRKGAF